MSAKKFKFVSPGVFLSEIDNSQLPKTAAGIGPIIIGRTRKGPALKPVKVSSYQEFVEVFGEPVPGNEGDDAWREGNGLAATAYAPYAAQAYLKSDINSPVTMVRLLGVQGDDAGDAGDAGWEATDAYGLFFAVSGTAAGDAAKSYNMTASLGAVFYATDGNFRVGVRGVSLVNPNEPGTANAITSSYAADNADGESVSTPVMLSGKSVKLLLKDGSTEIEKSISLRRGPNYIRDVLNTNPVSTNDKVSTPPAKSLAGKYWLGETFEEGFEDVVRSADAGGPICAFVLKLDEGMEDFKSANHQLSAASTGWVIPQYIGENSDFVPESQQRLFRLHALSEGEQGMDLSIHIEDIRIPEDGSPTPFGTFSVVVKQRRGDRIVTIDSYENLNLNPNSNNFIARRIGDQYFVWDGVQKRNKLYGQYPNQSSHIRVEMNLDVLENGPADPSSVPFGFLGPIVPADCGVVTAAISGDAHNRYKATFGTPAEHWVAAGSVLLAVPTDAAAESYIKTLKLQVPGAATLVVSGSKSTGFGGKYVMGHSEYEKVVGTTGLNDTYEVPNASAQNFSVVNKGAKDFLRKASAHNSNAVLTAQTNGYTTAASTAAKYSYIFTMDDIIVEGSDALSSEMSSYKPDAVYCLSGSRRGFNKATATWTYTAGIADGQTITITDALGTTKTFEMGDAADYSAAGTNIAVTEKTEQGGNELGECRALVLAINAQTDLKITASNTGTTIVLTQDIPGPRGNTAITVSNIGTWNTSVSGTPFTAGVSFEGHESIQLSSFTARTGSSGYPLSASALLEVVDAFAMPMHGGFDGVDITEANPFNMGADRTHKLVGPDATTANSYAYASIDRAIELIKDPEAIEMNLAVMPGVTNSGLTTKLIQTCEARADAMAIIDLPDVYVPPSQKICSSFADRIATTPAKAAKALRARKINSSYGAAYYPWVKVRDSIKNRDVWVPPSVIALGVMGYTEQRDEVWFAPAGFNRGGLNEGNAGLAVLQASEQLLSSERDTLYDANINPIASFVSEGLVVFGQKTLQNTASALDRINVRRLLIFVKKEVSRISNGLLFDQNVPATWARFTGQVVPFLESVKSRLGLTDFKVVLDKSTTTPDLVDRNIMYAKIFLKPARAIEFIAVDFVITRSGASFDD